MTFRISPLLSLLAVSGLAAMSVATPAQVAASADQATPLKVGAVAPDATLRGLDGKTVRLKRLLAHKPTVLIFYRGGWCPFCNAHLSDLAKIEGEIRSRGYQILAISPDLPAELAKMTEKDHLTYRLFSDSPAEAMRKFGVAFRVDDDTFKRYRESYDIDLERWSGQTHHILPVPSVFVLDKSGRILFAHSSPDYKVRMKADDLLQVLADPPQR